MDPLTRCARIPVDLTMSGGSEAMKMFHVSVCCAPRSCPPRGRLRAVQGCAPGPGRRGLPHPEDRICGPKGGRESWVPMTPICLLYTSDAADE